MAREKRRRNRLVSHPSQVSREGSRQGEWGSFYWAEATRDIWHQGPRGIPQQAWPRGSEDWAQGRARPSLTPRLQLCPEEWGEVGLDGDTDKFLRQSCRQECQEELDRSKTCAEATGPWASWGLLPAANPSGSPGLSPLRSLQASKRPLSVDLRPRLSLTRVVSP